VTPAVRWRSAGLAAAIAFLALSCTPGRPVERPVVVFWTSWPEAAVAPLVARFEAATPGARVSVRTWPADELADSAAAAVAAGHAPDLCELPGEALAPWLASGGLSDWSAGVADLRPVLRGWEQCMVGDAIYGLPWTLSTPVLLVNLDLAARAGLGPDPAPATWDALRTAAARVDRLAGVHGIGLPAGDARDWAGAWLPWVAVAGGRLLSDGLDSSRVASGANQAALEHVRALAGSALLAPPDSLARAFAEGRLGFLFVDAAGAPAAVGLRTTAVPLPPRVRGEEAAGAWARGEVLVSFTTSRRKEDALRLARFLLEPASLSALAVAEPAVIPARVDADTLAVFRDRPVALAALRELVGASFPPHVAAWPDLESRLGDAVADVVRGPTPVARALASADSFVTARLAARGTP